MITDEQLRQLAASGEFQELLQNDEHIKKLEALKYNPRDEYIALSDVLGWNPMFRSLKLNRLTPALWAFLWTLRSPYTQEEMYKADELDTDIFLYLLTVDLREGDVSPKKIVIAAIGFCRKHGICWQEARAWLCERVHFAFRAGGMLPRTDSWSDNAHVFDADWLTFFCSIVAQETREKVSVVMYDMGLGSCCYYFIQALRKKNKKRRICKRTDAELCKQIYEYSLQLGEKFLAGKAEMKGDR